MAFSIVCLHEHHRAMMSRPYVKISRVLSAAALYVKPSYDPIACAKYSAPVYSPRNRYVDTFCMSPVWQNTI